MNTVATGTVTPADLAIDARNDLACGERVLPGGELAVPVPLAGTPRTEICEHPATHCIGVPRVVEVEKNTLTDELEWKTETHTENELAVLSCGVHKARAVEHWRAFERVGTTGWPTVAELAEDDR